MHCMAKLLDHRQRKTIFFSGLDDKLEFTCIAHQAYISTIMLQSNLSFTFACGSQFVLFLEILLLLFLYLNWLWIFAYPANHENCFSAQLTEKDGTFNVAGIENFVKELELDKCRLSYVVVFIMGPQSSAVIQIADRINWCSCNSACVGVCNYNELQLWRESKSP